MLWVRIPLSRSVLDITLCDKVFQWFAAGRWLYPGTLISSANKTDRHYITETPYPLWYLMLTSLVSPVYIIGIVLLPHWYRLITPLVSSDYPFGIFWLPIRYLLIIPLISSLSVFLWLTASHYPICIFWLPHLYILITHLVSSDYPFWYLHCLCFVDFRLLTIPFVFCDYPFGILYFPFCIFWLPHRYL